LTLTVDRLGGSVHGVASGPIGDAVLLGTRAGDAITASVSRRDPLDRGFTGTLRLNLSGERLFGTMRLSVSDARLVREASVTLSREKP
jgi:hypothetical protein